MNVLVLAEVSLQRFCQKINFRIIYRITWYSCTRRKSPVSFWAYVKESSCCNPFNSTNHRSCWQENRSQNAYLVLVLVDDGMRSWWALISHIFAVSVISWFERLHRVICTSEIIYVDIIIIKTLNDVRVSCLMLHTNTNNPTQPHP